MAGPRTTLSPKIFPLSRSLLSRLLPEPFSGLSSENPVEFLRKVETNTFNLDIRQLKFIISSTLTGSPGSWWRDYQSHVHSTQALLSALRQNLVSSDTLEHQIQQTRQMPRENGVAFIESILLLFNKLPAPETDQLVRYLSACSPCILYT